MRPSFPNKLRHAPDSLAVRVAVPLASGAWAFFLGWTVLLAIVWTWSIGDSAVHSRVTHPELRAALIWLLHAADPLWLGLAATNGYFSLVTIAGLNAARRWALTVAGVSFAAAALSVWMAWPLGAIRFTDRLGAKIGPMPLGLPLLWFVVVLGARAWLLRALPRASHVKISLGTGGLAGLFAVVLEPVATHVRVWWLWRTRAAGPLHTFQSATLWLIVGALLAFLLRENAVARGSTGLTFRPAIALGLLFALVLLAHLGRALGL